MGDVPTTEAKATETRLKILQTEWEKKVRKRLLHLQKNHLKYGISSDFKYLIVTKAPEIISHFSDFLILSLREFGLWIKENDWELSFDRLYQKEYKLEDTLTKDQLNSITKDLLKNWTFAKE